MLQFKQRQPEQEELPSRWKIGVDRRNVAAYAGLALIAGLTAGFLIARSMTRKQESALTLANDARQLARPAGSNGQPSIQLSTVD